MINQMIDFCKFLGLLTLIISLIAIILTIIIQFIETTLDTIMYNKYRKELFKEMAKTLIEEKKDSE